jgi:hypothetical protein
VQALEFRLRPGKRSNSSSRGDLTDAEVVTLLFDALGASDAWPSRTRVDCCVRFMVRSKH